MTGICWDRLLSWYNVFSTTIYFSRPSTISYATDFFQFQDCCTKITFFRNFKTFLLLAFEIRLLFSLLSFIVTRRFYLLKLYFASNNKFYICYMPLYTLISSFCYWLREADSYHTYITFLQQIWLKIFYQNCYLGKWWILPSS